MIFNLQDEGQQRKWLDGRVFDFPTQSLVSMKTMSADCNVEKACSETGVTAASASMLHEQGRCSALLTREGFFDFFIFRTECNVSHPVALVCQYSMKNGTMFNNDKSDVKVFKVNGFYSLQVFSACDIGWFMVDNMCINIYFCQGCKSNKDADEQCHKQGSYLANKILNNVTITSPGNIVRNNTELSLFWGMFHHIGETQTFAKNSFPYVTSRERSMNLAVNGTAFCDSNNDTCAGNALCTLCDDRDLCDNDIDVCDEVGALCDDSDECNDTAYCDPANMTTPCSDSNMVLSVKNKFHAPQYLHSVNYEGIPKSFFNMKSDYTLLWSVIDQPSFQIKEDKHFALCEKSTVHDKMYTNCSDSYFSCNDGTCVHDSLVCDGQPHCLNGEDEADCKRICSDYKDSCISHCHHRDLCFCLPGFFQCLSGGCVPLQKLCDKTEHCADASDEPPTCVYLRPEKLGEPTVTLSINSYINALIHETMDIQHRCFQDNVTIPINMVHYEMHAHQPNCSVSSSRELKFWCSSFYIPVVRSQHEYSRAQLYRSQTRFSLDRLCIYEHDCDDHFGKYCSSGFHLLKCENMYCVGRFKCLSSYCISFDYICNKVCDCPRCEDENICSKLLCPGLVLTEQMGSVLRCSQNVVALKHSMNMRQVIHRKSVHVTDDLAVLIHSEGMMNLTNLILKPQLVVYCQITHSQLSDNDLKFFPNMVSVKRLLLPYNGIQTVQDSMFMSMSQLIILDLSHNSIQYLSNYVLCPLHKLQYLSLHHNLISSLQNHMFIYIPNVQVLLLQTNPISPQSINVDVFLPSLYRLTSDIPRLCCIFEAVTYCSPPFNFLIMSCSDMIKSRVQMVLGWLIEVSTCFSNIICLLLMTYKHFACESPTLGAAIPFSVNLVLSELVTSVCLLSYSFINLAYQGVFGIIADKWRYSLTCLSLECLFAVSSQASLAFAVCLSVHFAIHIPSMTRRGSSPKAVLGEISVSWIIVTSICISLQILEYMHNVDPFNYFCFPFTTALPSEPIVLSLQIATLALDNLLVMVCLVSYGSLLVFTIKEKRSKALKSISTRQERLRKFATRVTILILSTILTWMPILSVQVLVLLRIPIIPDIYLWCVLVSIPVNLIIDPVLLIRSMLM